MELNLTTLSVIAQTNPGDFAIYMIKNGRMTAPFRSGSLPALSGMSPEEYDAVAKDDAAAIVLDCDRPRVAALLGKILSDRRDADFTYRILHKTKGSVWVHAKARCIGELNGAPVLMVIFQDTTGEAEEHAVLLNNTSAIVYVVDADTHELLYANEPARNAWNCGNYSGRLCHRLIGGGDAPCEWCPVRSMENGFFHADSHYFPRWKKWFSISCRAMDWHGRRAAAVYASDVTEAQKHRKSLELDKRSLETIVGNIPIGVGVCEIRDGRVVTTAVNAQLTEMLGMTAENFSSPGAGVVKRLHPNDLAAVLASVSKIRSQGGNLKFSFRFRPGEASEYRWFRAETRTVQQTESRTVFVCVSDVTAEREAQAERDRSRRIYESAVEEAKLVTWEYDIGAHRVVMSDNESTEYDYRKFGLPKVIENAPTSLAPMIDERSVGDFLRMYREVEDGAPRASCEVWYKLKPGQDPRCERIVYTTIFGADGKPLRACGIGQNITAQKLEEKRYALAYRRLADAHPYTLGSFELNLSKNLCGSGKSPYPFILALQEPGTADGYFLGLSRLIADEAVRNRFREIYNRSHLTALFREGRIQLSFEYPIRYPDGVLHWHSALLFLLQNPAAGDVEAVTYMTDITDKKRSDDIISIIMSDGFDYIGLIRADAQTFEFLRKSPGIAFPAVGQRVLYDTCRSYVRSQFISPEELEHFDEATLLKRILADLEQNSRYTVSYRRTENGTIRCKQLDFRWFDRNNSEILVTRLDVTAAYEREQKQLRAIEEAKENAEKANRAKEEFLSRISHDIRTPISIIKSMTAFAFEDIDSRDRLLSDLRKIEVSNTFLLSLINDVLDISKIDSGNIELHPEPYLLDDYISNIRNMFEPLCQKKGLRFSVERTAASAAIVADRIRINQITLNLLSNAVKYTPEGGSVTLTAEEHRLSDGSLRCGIEVRDTGIGMSSEFQKTMFEPFSQEYDNPGRPKAGSGTGLGLSIVKRLVDLIGGTISVKSELGKGTDIRVEFSASASDVPTGSKFSGDPGLSSDRLSGKVLLAEDNEINTEIAVRILEDFGLTVETAANGKAAAERFEASAPGEFLAIFMDIQMPLMNGYEATERIRSLRRPDAAQVPIIAMTADAFSAALEHSLKSGMNAYVTKPLDPALIRDTLGRHLRPPHAV